MEDGTSARVMDAKGPNVERVIYHDTNGQAVNPFTGKRPEPPSPVPSDWKQQYREQTHLELNP